jgi:hypothetical protein
VTPYLVASFRFVSVYFGLVFNSHSRVNESFVVHILDCLSESRCIKLFITGLEFQKESKKKYFFVFYLGKIKDLVYIIKIYLKEI